MKTAKCAHRDVHIPAYLDAVPACRKTIRKEATMNKKVLIISSTPRKGGNSDILCDEFAAGAKEAGNKVEKVRK